MSLQVHLYLQKTDKILIAHSIASELITHQTVTNHTPHKHEPWLVIMCATQRLNRINSFWLEKILKTMLTHPINGEKSTDHHITANSSAPVFFCILVSVLAIPMGD